MISYWWFVRYHKNRTYESIGLAFDLPNDSKGTAT